MPTNPSQTRLPATFLASPGRSPQRGRPHRLQRSPEKLYRPLGHRVIWGMSVDILGRLTSRCVRADSSLSSIRGYTMNALSLLKIVLVVFGIAFLLIYPLAIVWPSGWAWHEGAPFSNDYYMMIVGVAVILGGLLWSADKSVKTH